MSRYVIGLTGNIATGKSTVAAMLARLGAYVLDADKLVHEALRAGTDVHRRVVARFGAGILDAHGEVDRAGLGALVFADPAALQDLERIVHPVVVEETLHRLRACQEPVAVVEAIKLLEAQMHRHCDAVWVVIARREQQLERLLRTRNLTRAQAELRLAAQPSVAEKLARAHVVIDNSHSLAETWGQVVRAWDAIPGVPPAPRDMAWELPAGEGKGPNP